jgi:Tol biopolymer transport system component
VRQLLDVVRKGHLLRLGIAFAAFALLSAQTCTKDNLGKGGPGPVSFRISVAPDTTPGNGDSTAPSISADGRYVVFASKANNLATPTSGFREIFLRDRWLDTVVNLTKLSQITFPGNGADCDNPFISPNGKFVTFECTGVLISSNLQSTPPKTKNIFVIDIGAKSLNLVVNLGLVSMTTDFVWPDADCTDSTISNDGKIISFHTSATNIPNCSTATTDKVVAANVSAGFGSSIVYTLVSHSNGFPMTPSNGGCFNPRLSANGSFIVFASTASNLTIDANPTNIERIYMAAPDGTGMTLVSRDVGAGGTPNDKDCASPSISGDGRFVAFGSFGGGILVPGATIAWVVRRDMTTFTNTLVGPGIFMLEIFGPPAGTDQTAISDDGRVVVYTGINAAQTDLQVNVVDLQVGSFAASNQVISPGTSLLNFPRPALSADGQWAVWSSNTAIQVVGDNNASYDVFGFGPIP